MGNRSNIIKMGEHIADLRKKKKYTQKSLGNILDVSDKTISKWEKGVVAPDITILQSLASALDVSIEEILSGEEIQNNTFDTTDTYSSVSRHKQVRLLLIILFLFIIITVFTVRVEEHYSWHLDSLYSNGNFLLDGYILTNNKETKIVVNKLTLTNEEDNHNIKSINMIVKNKDEIIYRKRITFNKSVGINDFLNNYVLSVELNRKIIKKNISIVLTTEDEVRNNKTYTYDFK